MTDTVVTFGLLVLGISLCVYATGELVCRLWKREPFLPILRKWVKKVVEAIFSAG